MKIENIKTIIIGALVLIVLALLLCMQCTNQNNKYLKNNIKALTDSINVVEMKNGKLLYEKQALILEKDDLQKYLKLSDDENKALKKQNLVLANKLNAKIQIDTIVMNDTVYFEKDSTMAIDFVYRDIYTYINGTTRLCNYNASTTINKLEMNTPLILGVTDEYKIIAYSDNPNLTITDIDAAAVEKRIKPKRWGIGPFLGVGLGYGLGTDFNGNNVGGKGGFVVGVVAGVSVHYDLFQW